MIKNVAAYTDQTRRPSQRQKDLLDILRLVEAPQQIRACAPDEIQRLPPFQEV
jgi:hypothetical protein